MFIKKKNDIYIFIILFLFVTIGVGYAYFNTTISINGSTALAKNTWDVHFENLVVTEGSVETVSPVKLDDTATLIDFSANFALPGDFYEFTVDVVNAGSMDAMLNEFKFLGVIETEDFFTYDIVYKEDGISVNKGDLLFANTRSTIVVRVEYSRNMVDNAIFRSDQQLDLNLSLTYVQKSSKNTLVSVMSSQAVRDDMPSQYVSSPTGINFSNSSSDSNGKGLYIRSGTENNRNPIYYYRGDVDNNNVLFAGMCWKIVRTTETGGVKLVYNGEERYSALNYDEYKNVSFTNQPFIFEHSLLTWGSDSSLFSPSNISFSVEEDGEYFLTYSGLTMNENLYVYIDDVLFGSYYPYYDGYYYNIDEKNVISLGRLTSSNIISVEHQKNLDSSSTNSFKFSISKKSNDVICGNTGRLSLLENTSQFNEQDDLVAGAGYMYGKTYTTNYMDLDDIKTGVVFGNDVVYENGTYTLKDTYSLTSSLYDNHSVINEYHYTCFTSSKSCSNVAYVFDMSYSYLYYIRLSAGNNIGDALKELFTKSSNKYDSVLKSNVDKWYKNNLSSYTSKLEDTVWCNDRSISYLGSWDKDTPINYANDDTYHLRFGAYDRIVNKSSPSFKCSNLNDSFTVSKKNGNGKLFYPVALLTVDELVFAGETYTDDLSNKSHYLYLGRDYWTMTPSYFDIYPTFFYLNGGYGISSWNSSANTGVRPAISLAPYTELAGGDGTEDNPYIIK